MAKTNSNAEYLSLGNSGKILTLIATGAATSRPALFDSSGLSRSTITQRLNALIGSGMIRETAHTVPSGGRPTRVLRLNERAGFLLVANIGETYIHLAVMDLEPTIVVQSTIVFSILDGAAAALDKIADEFDRLVATLSGSHGALFGISLALPTPVDFKRGRIVGPSVLHGWDEFDITEWLWRRFNAPIYIENDVNLMAICEHRQNFPHVDDMFFIKAGTGIGSGIITGGKLFRGAQGAAGDIGHIQFNSENLPLCRCGKLGCVEARAGGWAIAQHLSKIGFKAENAHDVMALVEMQKSEALMQIRTAGRVIGEVVSDVVSILNPSLIVIGGTLSNAGELLLSGVRELVYQRCLPLATRELQIVLAKSHKDNVLFGAAFLALEDLFSDAKIENLIERFARDYMKKL